MTPRLHTCVHIAVLSVLLSGSSLIAGCSDFEQNIASISGIQNNEVADHQGSIADHSKAIKINPQDANAYGNRGNAKMELKDYQGAIADYTKVIEINPQDALAYSNRGLAKGIGFNDNKGACSAFKKAASLGHEYRITWLNSADGAWCRNMR